MSLKLTKVTSTVLSAVIPVEGELMYAVDTNQLFIGDGTTVGGHNVDSNGFEFANFAPMAAGDGFTGSRGATGFTGSRGATGLTGLTGSRGFAGSRGDTGFAGSRGSNGTPGLTGSRGFVGSQGFAGSRGYAGSTGAGFTGSRGSIGFTGSAGGGGSSSSLTNGNNIVALGADGTLTFPGDSITQPSGTELSIKTDNGPLILTTVVTPGTGFTNDPDVIATTTGGSGTGLTVRVRLFGSGVQGVKVVNPGTGYQNNDVLTLVAGSGIGISTGCTIRLTLVMTINDWNFGAEGVTKFPGMFDFAPVILPGIDQVSGNTMVFSGRKTDSNFFTGQTAVITTEPGTAFSPDSQDICIQGGIPYSDASGDTGNIILSGSRGHHGGSILMDSGTGGTGGEIQITAGDGLTSTEFSPNNFGVGGRVLISAGRGHAVAGSVSINAGAAFPPDGGTARAGDVTISAGNNTNSTSANAGGNVYIQAGLASQTGKSGKVEIKTNNTFQSGGEHPWKFDETGVLTVPGSIIPDTNIAYDLGSTTKRFRNIYLNTINLSSTAPAHSYGAAGDKAGMVAFDSNYIYYCTADYVDNTTNIWKRTAHGTGTW